MKRTSTEPLNAAGAASLTGIVLAVESARCIRIRTWLEARHSALCLHVAADARSLDRALSLGHTDFVIVVVPDERSSLPTALRRVKHVHSLVLIESAGIGALPDWLYQGADAVCSLRDTHALRRALDTLIDVCRLRRRLTLLRAPDSRQSAMLRGLMSAQAAAPSVLANGSRLSLRSELAGTTQPLIDATGAVDATALRTWQALALEKRVRTGSASQAPPDRAGTKRTSSERTADERTGTELRWQRQAITELGMQRSEKALRRSSKIISRERAARVASHEAMMIRSEARPALELRVEQHLATRPPASACAALRLNFTRPGREDSTTGSAHAASASRLDIGVWKAAGTLSRHFDTGTLLARPGRHCLLLLRQACLIDQARFNAGRIRELLGSLDGLIGSTLNIRIHTLNMATVALTARELLVWLDDSV